MEESGQETIANIILDTPAMQTELGCNVQTVSSLNYYALDKIKDGIQTFVAGIFAYHLLMSILFARIADRIVI